MLWNSHHGIPPAYATGAGQAQRHIGFCFLLLCRGISSCLTARMHLLNDLIVNLESNHVFVMCTSPHHLNLLPQSSAWQGLLLKTLIFTACSAFVDVDPERCSSWTSML